MKYIGIFTLLLFPVLLLAQERVTLGMEMGPNYSTIRGNSKAYGSSAYRIKSITGLFARYKLTKHVSLKTALYYEQITMVSKTDVWVRSSTGASIERPNITFHYLTVPLLMHFAFGKKLQCFVNAGASAGFLLKETEYFGIQGDVIYGANTGGFKNVQYGVTGGIGLSYPVGERFSISGELRDNLGLSNIRKNNGNIKTNAASFLFGVGCKL